MTWTFLAISESGRRDFLSNVLNRLSGGLDFTWHSCPSHGRSGGILLGVKSDSMEVVGRSGGDFHLKVHIRNKTDNFIWSLVAVYGAALKLLRLIHIRLKSKDQNEEQKKILLNI